MTVAVKTLWVSRSELEGIWDALIEARHDAHDVTIIENIMLECGVAEARAETLYPEYSRMAIGLGKTGDTIPFKLQPEEHQLLSALPLKRELKEILH